MFYKNGFNIWNVASLIQEVIYSQINSYLTKRTKWSIVYTLTDLPFEDHLITIIPITIRAYALGHEDKIVVFRKATFTFPRLDIIA